MKTITLQLDDQLHHELKLLCTHRGHQAHLIRQGIRMVIEVMKKEVGKDDKIKEEG